MGYGKALGKNVPRPQEQKIREGRWFEDSTRDKRQLKELRFSHTNQGSSVLKGEK
jgi:hypothetical protein